jgi:alanine dehydrogenase
VLVGAHYLAYPNGGLGLLASGVPGVAPAEILIIGGGVVGINAAKMAAGLGARVIILDVSAERMKYLDDVLPANCKTVHSDRSSLEHYLALADLVIGAVLVAGTVAPKLVTREMLHLMKPRSVVVDVAVDQGGCFETTHATTHQDPVYYEEGVLHYAVANMPGAYPCTSTLALTNVTLPYVLDLANKGVTQAVKDDPALALGVNVWHGQLTCKGVGVSQDRACTLVGALI